MSGIHINYGRSRRKAEPDEKCMYCDRHFKVMAYCYFGAPVCGVCWDSYWRKTEDGECDPPFAEINNPHNCEWLTTGPGCSGNDPERSGGTRNDRAVSAGRLPSLAADQASCTDDLNTGPSAVMPDSREPAG